MVLLLFYHYWQGLLIERRLIKSLPGWQVLYPSDDQFVPMDCIWAAPQLRFSHSKFGTLELVEFSPSVSSVIYRYLVVRTTCDVGYGIYGGRGRFISRQYNYYYSKKLQVYERLSFNTSLTGTLLMDVAECCVVDEGYANFYIELPQFGLGRAGKQVLHVLDFAVSH